MRGEAAAQSSGCRKCLRLSAEAGVHNGRDCTQCTLVEVLQQGLTCGGLSLPVMCKAMTTEGKNISQIYPQFYQENWKSLEGLEQNGPEHSYNFRRIWCDAKFVSVAEGNCYTSSSAALIALSP
ncbi:hypothetical protein AAES_78380 [Amazona aestiva]|uniref:Uncharacterized protein n=1 Tax=Amazona aestiva TaxID=12930 RepID=A0A0Q3MGR0_AMAAE|nr:hypothetical protein AAES_78380 [Amazona aestiva]